MVRFYRPRPASNGMKIFIKAKTNAREEKIEKVSKNRFNISVKASPIQGKANIAIVKVLAKYLNVSPSAIRIVAGGTSRNKIIEINE